MRVPSLFLLAVLVLLLPPFAPSTSAASGPPAELDRALESVRGALTDGAASPRAVETASARLRRVPTGERGPVSDLLTRLEAQLAPLTAPATPAAERRDRARRALATLDALSRKMGVDAAPPPPSGEPSVAALVPGNDDCANATVVSAAGTLTGSTTEATNDGAASCGGSATAADVWYSYTAAADGLVAFDTFGSDLDTVLSLHSACPDGGGDHELSCSDDARGGLTSLLGRQMTGGETVYVRVSGAGGATGGFELNVDDTAGGIRGRVTKEASGEAAEARIQVYSDRGYYEGYVATEGDGTYLFPGLATGDWYLYADSVNLVNEVWDDVPCTSYCYPEDVGTPVAVSGDLVEGVDFALAAGGSISGRVTDSATGEGVNPYYYTGVAAHAPDGGALSYADTDYEGHYTLSGLPAGDYTVRASHYDYQDELWDGIPCELNCDVTIGDPVSVTAGSTTEGIDFPLERLGAISGSVTSAIDGSPLSGFWVTAFHATTGYYADDGYASQGEYRIEGLPTGDYFVVTESYDRVNEVYDDLPCLPTCPIFSGDPVSAVVEGETTGIDFALENRGVLRGTVEVEDGGDFDIAYVAAYNEAGYDVAWGYAYPYQAEWEIDGLVPGTYYLKVDVYHVAYEDQVFSDLGCAPSCDPTQGTPISVAASSIAAGFNFLIDRCSAASYLELANLILYGSQAEEACRTIHAGSNVTVKGGGDLVLTAGRSVSFGNGFSVQSGGDLTVVIDPAVASD